MSDVKEDLLGVVIDAFSQVLDGAEVRAEDDFLDLGGHSILAARLARIVCDARGVPCDAVDVLRCRNPLALTADLAERPRVMHAAPATVPSRGLRSARLSENQTVVWFMQQLYPDSLAYTAHSRLKVRGTLDVERLRRALANVLARHQALRLVIDYSLGVPTQSESADWLEWDILTVESWNGQNTEEVIRHAVRKPFDMHNGPLIRWTLIQEGLDEWTLVQSEHHLIHDARSWVIIVDELIFYYENPDAYVAPASAEWQYLDFTSWQHEWLQSQDADRQKEYWLDELRELADLPPLRMPGYARANQHASDKPDQSGGLLRFPLDKRLNNLLHAAAQRHRTTPYAVMLAVTAKLSSAWAPTECVAIASAYANRRKLETERIVGMLVNTVVQKFRISNDSLPADVIKQATAVSHRSFRNQEYPFRHIVQEINPKRIIGRNPFTQVSFGWTEVTAGSRNVDGLDVRVAAVLPTDSAKYDLRIVAFVQPTARASDSQEIEILWEYADDAFGEREIEEARSRWLRILESYCNAPVEVDIPPEGEPVVATVMRRSIMHPARPAVEDRERVVTYAELAGLAEAVARELKNTGVGRGKRVGVTATASIEYVVGVLATGLAGAAYVPLDPRVPRGRLLEMIRVSGVDAVITTADDAADYELTRVEVSIDGAVPGRVGNPVSRWDPSNAASDAYVIFTSGSTGRQRGVAVGQRSLSNLVRWSARKLGYQVGDRCALNLHPAFDGAVWELWAGLTTGLTLCISPQEARSSAAALRGWLVDNQINIACIPTVYADELYAASWPAAHSLRVLTTGGDKLHTFPKVGQLFTAWNLYGPAEATIITTAYRVPAKDKAPDNCTFPPIGYPIDGVRIYVADADERPVPVGEVGVLMVAGANLARGYLDEITNAERFVFDGEGTRWYMTGDLVRQLPDGALDFVGRDDGQVQVRGMRIELGDVEHALIDYGELTASYVGAWFAADHEVRLVAYVVIKDGRMFRPEDIRDHLKRRLPAQMIPFAILSVDSLPLTTFGKVDRDALPQPRWAISRAW